MPKNRTVRRPLSVSLARFTSSVALLAALVTQTASAANNIFTGPSGTWNSNAQWTLGTAPSATDALLLNASSPLNSGLDASFTSQTLALNLGSSTAYIDANFLGSGDHTLTLTGGTNALGGTDLIATGASMTGSAIFGTTANGIFGVALGANGNINVANASASLFFGSESAISGNFNLTKTGNGTLTLAGNNTFGGSGRTFTLSSGTLRLESFNALGNTATAFIINGGTLDNASGFAVTMANRPITLGGNFSYAGSGDLNLGAGAVTLTASREVNVSSGNLTLGGTVSGAGFNINKTGSGTLTLGPIATTTGSLNVTGGTLALSSAANSFTGNVTIDGAGSVLQIGTGNNNGNGNTTTAALGIVTGGTAYKTVTLTNGGAFRISSSYNVNTSTAALPGAGQVFIFGTGGGFIDTPGGTTMTIDDGAGTGTATTAAQLQGSGTLTKIGLGALSLGNGTSDFSNFTGAIIVNEGTLVTSSGTFQLGDLATGTTVNSGATLDVRNVLSAEPISVIGTGTGGNGALITATGSTGTVPGVVTLAGDASVGGGGTLNVTGTLNNSNFTVTKVGAGTTTFSGTSTGTGGSFVLDAGTLGASNPGTTTVIDSLGTASVKLNAGTFNLKANGPASSQNFTFTNSLTVAGSAVVDVNRIGGANTGSTITVSNLNLDPGAQMTVKGSNFYSLNVTNPITLIGNNTVVADTAHVNLLGKINTAGNSLTVSGGSATRLLNTATGGNANALAGTVNVTGGNLLAFAPAADAIVQGSNTLGTATIALSGTNPTLRLAPSLQGGLNTAPVDGLLDKSYTGTNLTSRDATNFLGATQPITTGTAGQNATGSQMITQINITAQGTATTSSHQYVGLINITTAGNYVFQSFTDDGGHLFIDGNAPITTQNTTVSGVVYLTAGLHTLTSRWNNNAGNGAAVVKYQGADTNGALIDVPASAYKYATPNQLTTNFGNHITFAAGSNSTIETASNTTLGTLTMVGTGTGTALNIQGSGDLTQVNATSLTMTDNLTFNNPTANVTLANGITTSGNSNLALVKNGFGALTVKGTFAPTGQITLNAGSLNLALNGAGSNGTIALGNDVQLTTNTAGITLDVRSNGGSTGNTVAFGRLAMPTTATAPTITLNSGDNYRYTFTGVALPGSTGANSTIVANADVTITGNVTSQMTGFTASNFDTMFLSGTSTNSAILGSIGEAGPFTPVNTGGYTRVFKTGTGTWTLSGANTYTGLTQVQVGTLRAGANNILSPLNLQGVDVNAQGAGSNAVFDIGATTQTINATGNALNLAANTATGTANVTGTGGTIILGGNVNYNAANNPAGSTISVSTLNLGNGNRTFAVGDSTAAPIDLTVSSNLNSGRLIKTGAGTLALTGALSLAEIQATAGTINLTTPANLGSTPVTVNGGSVNLNGQAYSLNSFTLTSGSLLNGSLTGTSLLKQGPGTLTLSTPTTVADVTVRQGLASITSSPATYSTLNVAFTGTPTADLINATATLTLGGSATALAGGGALAVTGAASTANSQSFASTTFAPGANAVTGTAGASGTVAVNLGTVSRQLSSTVDFVLPSGTQSATNGIIFANPGTAGTLVSSNGTAYATVGGNDWAAYSATSPGNIVGASVAGAGGASLYTAANSAATFTGHANITGAFTSNSGSTVDSIRLNTGTPTLTLTGTTTVNSGGILFGSGLGGAANITGGTIVPGTGQELVILSNKANTLNTISSVLGNGASGATSVTYRGIPGGSTTGGTIDIKANNTYTGPTYITGGRVATQSSAVTTPFGTGQDAIVYVDGNADGQFFSNQPTTIANPFVIVGTGLNEGGTRLGAIRLQSTAANSTPTLSGQITMMGDASIGSGTAVANGYGLFSGNFVTSTAAGATSFALTKAGAGYIKLSGTNNQTTTNIAAGILNINSDAALGVAEAPVVFTANSSLQFNNALTLPATRNIIINSGVTGSIDTYSPTDFGSSEIAGVISGPGGLRKAFYVNNNQVRNNVTLSGQNTFTGNAQVEGGWLTITNSSSLGTGAKTVTINNNTNFAPQLHLNPGAGAPIDLPANMTFSISASNSTTKDQGSVVNDAGHNIIRGQININSGGGSAIFASNAGSLTLNGNVTAIATGRILILRGDAAGSVNGVISNGSTADLGVQRDLGTGTWALNGANTFTGTTTVNAGTLKIGHVSALGSPNSGTSNSDNQTIVTAGGTLDLGNQTEVGETIRLAGNGVNNEGALVNHGAAASIGSSVSGVRASTATGYTVSGTPSLNFLGTGLGATGTALFGVTTGSFAITGGTTVYSAAPTVTISGGGGTGATATAVLTGGVVTGITITNAGTGFSSAPTIAFSAGTVTTAGTNPTGTGNNTAFQLNSFSITNQGTGYNTPTTVSIANTTHATATYTAATSGVILTGNSSIGGTGDIAVNGYFGETGGSFGVTKIGTNSVFLNGTNAYTGATSVQSGAVVVGGVLTGSAITVTDNGVANGLGGVLGGTGTVGNVTLTATTPGSTVGGTINPGLPGAAGTLNIGTGAGVGLSLNLGSTWAVDLGGSGAGEYDRLNFAPGSSLSLGGKLTGSFLNGYQPVQGDLFFLAIKNGGTITGTFSNAFDLGGQSAVSFGGQTFLISTTANFLGDGNAGNSFTGGDDLALQAVPEPGTSFALLTGLGLLLAGRRRRQA